MKHLSICINHEDCFFSNALRELHTLQEKDQLFIHDKLLHLILVADINKYPKIKKLKGLPFYRYRTGNFRIFFDIEKNIFTIYKILRRSENTYK